jgi:uncharacterized protein (TIGR02246 family)
MAARNPEEFHRLFAEAFSAGNLDALMNLYEPTAKLISQPGQPAVSGQAIREGLRSFLALKPTIAIETESVVKTEDLALLRSKWTLRGTEPDGKPIEMTHRGAEVLRRQPDGTWRLVIDHPFGAD